MGSGAWSDATYTSTVNTHRAKGTDHFAYNAAMAATPMVDRKCHEEMDPRNIQVRESRDSAEHPESLAIAILFDVTGSMLHVPRDLQKRMLEMFGLLLRKGYVEHPQLLFGAIGDSHTDRAPLQLGQFESDNRCDDWLGRIWLEGNGGGGNHEGYETALLWMARNTSIDCWEKRGHKGYLFVIGDECAYNEVAPARWKTITGDDLENPVSLGDAVAEAMESYEVFYIHPTDASYVGVTENTEMWSGLLGQNYITTLSSAEIPSWIAVQIGVMEGVVDPVTGLAHVADVASDVNVDNIGAALVPAGAVAGGAVAVVDAPTDLATNTDGDGFL